MKNKSNSKKSVKYDEAVVKQYKKFVGENELKILSAIFSSEKFSGTWKQVLCSPSTRLLGTGTNFSSVQATYADLNMNGLISVKNEAYDTDFDFASISGKSRPRVENLPMCRTVQFNDLFEGDYWIIFATPSFDTFIVVAPVILRIFNRPVVITKNFGLYVLTRDVSKFWHTKEEYEPTFMALNKYGFDKFWNRPVATAETYKINTI
jgi:lipocalin